MIRCAIRCRLRYVAAILLAVSSTAHGQTGLIGHWKLDETSGTTAVDSSSSGDDGTYTNGPVLNQPGAFPGAKTVQFDGTNDLVDLPDNSTDFSQGFSVALWIRPTIDPGSFVAVFNMSNGQDVDDIRFGWDTTVGIEIYISDTTDGGVTRWLVDNTPPVVGAWEHCVATIDASGNAKIYRNGVETASGYTSLPANVTRMQDSIGTSAWNDPFPGRIDDVRVYDRPLTAQEVMEIYSGLIAHWTFDEGAGTTIADSSSNSSDASFATGSPTWISGVFGGALDFSTLGDTAQTDAAFDPPATGAVAYWMRAAGPLSARERIFGLNGNWEARVETNGTISFDLGASPFVGNEPFATTTTVDVEDRWYHVVANFDATDDAYQVYINGELEASGISPVDLVQQSPAILSFATRIGSTEYWRGALDDFRIYERQLSATEVSKLYGLVGHWKMDEGAGATAADSTGFANDVTLAGATWTSDCDGNNGLEFDGLGDTAATNSVFDPPATGAIAAWLRSAGNPGARSRPFGVGGDWEMRQEPDGTLSFDLGGEGPDVGAGPDEFITTEGLSFQDRWYHVIAQFDASDDSFEVYIDGVLVNSGVNGNDMVKQLANTLTFGTRTGNTEYWEGGMRDFRVYDRWLVASEISQLSGLLAYWRLDDTSGTVAVDSGPFGNDATYVGGPTLAVPGAFPPETATAVELDGATQSITSGKSLLNDLTEFTIAGWVRPSNTNPDKSFFGQNGLIEVGIDFSSSQIDLWTSSGGAINVAAFLPPGKWSHVLATGNGNGLKLYVDGVEVASGGTATASYGSNSATMKIGEGVLNPTGDYFDGRVDDVRVYSRAVCGEEARDIYKGGRPTGVRILQWLEAR